MRPQRVVHCALGLAIAAVPGLAYAAQAGFPTPHLLAACDDVVETTDSFSMNCVPTMIPDMSDQLTEAEVAEPGFNAVPGGGTAGRR